MTQHENASNPAPMGGDIEITQEMIEAGVEVLECRLMELDRPSSEQLYAEVVADLYRAMRLAQP